MKAKKQITRKDGRVSVPVRDSGWIQTGEKLALCLAAAIAAIGPLEWDDKRRILRWCADVFGIDPKQL